MKILSIGQTHDFNVCLYDSNCLFNFNYIKEERLSNKKHDYGFDKILKFIEKEKFTPDLIVVPFGVIELNKFSLHSEIFKNFQEMEKKLEKTNNNFKDYELFNSKREIVNNNSIKKNKIKIKNIKDFIQKLKFCDKPIQWVQHDYAHILSGWILEPDNLNEFKIGVSIDGGGPDRNNKLIVENPFDIQNSKVLYFSRNIKITNKKIISMPNSFGEAIKKIGINMNLKGSELDIPGKIMGLSSYGEIDQKKVLNFNYKKNINYLNLIFYNKFKNFKDSKFENKKFLNLVATFNEIWKKCVLFIFDNQIPDNLKNKKIIYSGGCAQNTVTNKFLKEIYKNLEIVPHCYDGGLSLGCLAFAIMQHDLKFPVTGFPYIQSDIPPEKEPSLETIKKIANLLSKGKIVGWYQGNGEAGPRALGNRSILMSPCIENGKNILNNRVKKREHWRPYAPSVLKEFAKEWFDVSESKYMMLAAKIKENKKQLVPAVVHEDGTSRIQTVSEEDNKVFYTLIHEFFKLTNIPMLLNTSLNEGGGPILGNPKQAINFFYKSKLDALCVGDKIYHYKPRFYL